jgi:ribonuclease J
MRLTIHRGAKEIGGSCVELQSENLRILIDFGLPLVDENREQFDWGKNIRLFFVPNRYTRKMAEDKSLFKFRSAKITYQEMQSIRNRLVVKDSYTTRRIFANKKDMVNSTLIYSMWEGYLPDVEPFWDKHNVQIVKIHSSGHAYIEESQKFVKAINPKCIIPNHTFYPEKYFDLFGSRVKIVGDKETINI